MANIAPKLIELSADKLRSLHKSLHKSVYSPAVLEVHHLTTTEMRRRGLEMFPDEWDGYDILVDTMVGASLDSLAESLPADMVEDVIKTTGSRFANVQLILTTSGYEMRLEKVEKVIREYKGTFTVYNEDESRSFGTYNTRPEAEARLKQIHQFKKADGFSPPSGVRAAARRAIGWIEDGKAGSGFTGVGRGRASQLAAGESVSLSTIMRMKSFFARHEVDKQAEGFHSEDEGFPSAGRVAWDAWGGDAGYAWAKSIADKNENVEKHNQGMHDQKTHGKWADNIADQINNGEHPEIEAANVTAFLMGAAKRTDHPDLTELSVGGTLLFGDEGMGLARKDMPQIPAERRGEFLSELQTEGVTVEEEAVDPKTLKPIQKEVSSSRSGAIYNNYKEQGHIPTEQRILISSDGYVIDGHHTWGAAVGFSFDNPDAKLPVYRIGLTAKEALDRSLAWTEAQGIEGQAIDAPKPTKKSLAWKPLSKHGSHDQKTHGSWANGSTGATEAAITARRLKAMEDGRIPGLPRDAQGRVICPEATGGYKAGIPEEVDYRGTTLTPEHSLWHHMVMGPDGQYEISQERRALHTKIMEEATNGIPTQAEPTFHLLGGGPASGKTSVVKSGIIGEFPSRKEAVYLNADDVKGKLPEFDRMRFSPTDGDFFNAAAFSHEESSIVTKRIQTRAIFQGQDVVLDGTGDSSVEKLAGKVKEATNAGYKLNALYVTVPTDVAWDRAAKRAFGEEKRYVPEFVVRGTHADVSRTFVDAIAKGLFNKVTLVDNTTRGNMVVIGQGSGSNFTIQDQGLYDAFVEKGK